MTDQEIEKLIDKRIAAALKRIHPLFEEASGLADKLDPDVSRQTATEIAMESRKRIASKAINPHHMTIVCECGHPQVVQKGAEIINHKCMWCGKEMQMRLVKEGQMPHVRSFEHESPHDKDAR